MSNLDSKRSSQLVLLTRLQTTVNELLIDNVSGDDLLPLYTTLEEITKKHKIIISALEDEPNANFDKITDDVEEFSKVVNAIQARLSVIKRNIQAQDRNLLDENDDQRSVISGQSIAEGPTNAKKIVSAREISFVEAQFNTFEKLMNSEAQSIFSLKSLLSSIEKLYEKHQNLTSLVCMSGIEEEEQQSFYARHQDFVERYFALANIIHHQIDEKSPSHLSKSENEFCSPQVKLPSIDLPKFNGSPDEWMTFRDTFKSLVHSNTSLSGSTKFRYLKTSITDRLSPIAHLPETDAGYDDAWRAILSFYDDKRKIVDKHIISMFAAKRMTSETHDELQKLINEFSHHTSALERIYKKEELYDIIIANLVSYRLDPHTRDLCETESKDEVPLWPNLRESLERRRKVLSTMTSLKSAAKQDNAKSQQASTKFSSYKPANTLVSNNDAAKRKCQLCNGNHFLSQCVTFLNLPVKQRFAKIREYDLCENCFGKHALKDCKSKFRCKKCNSSHHTALHYEEFVPASSSQQQQQHKGQSINATSLCNAGKRNSIVLLSTALVNIQDHHGNSHTVRALLDSGSDSNYVTKSVAQSLKLRMKPADVVASGLGENRTVIKNSILAKISSRNSQYQLSAELLVTTKITGNVPFIGSSKEALNIPKGISLADPGFNHPGRIDVLLGSEFFFDLLVMNQIRPLNGPLLQETVFGWTVVGKTDSPRPITTLRQCNLVSRLDLKETFERFYKDEDYRSDKGFLTEEEEFCERTFEQTHKRDDSGRFVIKIPLRDNVESLACNRGQAMCRFIANEKRLQKNDRLRLEYNKFMKEYEELGHMQEVSSADENSGFYLPHHAVENPDSTTTKVRIVFDASAKTRSGLSFNDVQCIGPNIQSDSFTLGLRFRQHPIVIKADIAKMYRTIEVIPEQWKYQLILWREHPLQHIKTYALKTVTYGTASAMFQATRCLKQLAIENRDKFPLAAEEIEKSFYVDDLASGAETSEAATELFEQIDSIIGSAKMKLRKVSSNDKKFIDKIPEADRESLSADNPTISMLGIKWNPSSDEIQFNVKQLNIANLTKRIILSEYAKIYDPSGLLAPVIFKFKRFMTMIHQLQGSWDEPISKDRAEEWIELASTITRLNDIRVPRFALLSNYITAQMHGFSDASTLGYGAVIYIRTEDGFGNRTVNILCAKSRVAPTQLISIVRLELNGTVVLANLMQRVSRSLSITFQSFWCWTDSAIVLHWLKKPPSSLQAYVAHRVSEVQNLSTGFNWRHVRSEDNPADILSRGSNAPELVDNSMWWSGPNFLKLTEDEWPPSIISIDPEEPSYASEFKRTQSLAISSQPALEQNSIITMVEKLATLRSVQRKLAPLMRCIYNMRARKNDQPKRHGKFFIDDFNDVEIAVSRAFQQTHMTEDFNLLRSGKQIPMRSNIKKLDAFWDTKHQLIKVGGRLAHASHLEEDHRHQILLPKCHFTTLIIRNVHLRNLHCGQQATHGFIKMKFWPLKARDLIRHQLHKCVTCFKAKPKLLQQFMGQLPVARVTPSPTFFNTGIDYAGPIDMKRGFTRTATTQKVYIALFVCLSTKAIHLEIVTDLSTEAFLAALTRFISRRGICANIYSDNGKNFVGANNKLKALRDLLSAQSTQRAIQDSMNENGITWHFIPPRAPEQGGLWEAGVKSMKHHLLRVTENACLTYEELSTIMCKIEAVLNSRPLIPLSNDPNDLQPLTAGHFLIGRPLRDFPQRDFTETPMNRLTRWDRIIHIQQSFWKRWIRDYLHQLQPRTKNLSTIPVKIGQMVLIKQDGVSSLEWPVGRIIQVMPGKDEVTRVVKVQTRNSSFVRPLTELAMLPDDDNDHSEVAGVC